MKLLGLGLGEGPALENHARQFSKVSANLHSQSQEEKTLSFLFHKEIWPPSSPYHHPPFPTLLGPGQQQVRDRQKLGQAEAA